MKHPVTILLLIISAFSISSSAQLRHGNYDIMLKSGVVHTENDLDQKLNEAIPAADVFNGYYYRIIQFNALPSKENKEQLEQEGIRLLSYMPYNSFFAAIPVAYKLARLQQFNVRTLVALKARDKLNNTLRFGEIPSHAKKVQGKADLVVQYYGNISPGNIRAELISRGYEILDQFDETHLFTIRIKENLLSEVTRLPFIKFIQAVAPDPVPDDTKGRSLHRSNLINADYTTGIHYDGSGVSIALADDGEVGPHIDFTGRLTNMLSTGAGGNHGDMTSGICIGAGNLDPVIRGMGTGAHLYVYDIGPYPQIVDAAQHLAVYGAVITSTSYSQGCNDYDVYSQQGDHIMHQLKVVEPVFSAGNNNGTSCGYGAGTQWGNITGGYKEGKNTIAVANLDSHGTLDNTSSIGPAADGRIKPDISANGRDEMSTDQDNTYQVGGGTSAACPGIAGVCSQLYQAYREITGQPNPEAALIKACLLNGAEDIGNPGPDYTYGFGRVNAYRAVKTLQENRYFSDSVNTGDTKNFSINVPAGTQRFKVMVLWLDVEGDAIGSVNLVNDLNMQVTDPSAAVFDPWVLNPAANDTTLDDPAVRGVDNLNNVEQVTIDNPSPGAYSISVNGFAVPQGPQKFYVVYEFIDDQVTLTYPNGGESFVPGLGELLRWDAFGNTGNFTLAYSLDSGSTWHNISTLVGGSSRQFDWTVKNAVTENAFIRVSRGANRDSNNVPLTIIKVPQNFYVVWACDDSLELEWDPVTGATAYEISKLGAMYMDSIGTSLTNTFVVHGLNPADTDWFSVKAIAQNNGKGRRALAIRKLPSNVNCLLAVDLSKPDPGFDVAVYPNPASGLFHVEIKNSRTGKIMFDVQDVNGREVFSKKNDGAQLNTDINLSGESKGIYLLNVTTDEKVYHLKLVVM